MTNDQLEVLDRLEHIAAKARLMARELRTDPKQCWNFTIQLSDLTTQLDKINKKIENNTAFFNGV